MSEARDRLERVLAPDVVDALVELVSEQVADRLEAMDHATSQRRWYTLAEAAERLGCSYDAARMRAKRGRLEVKRDQGRSILVSARSLDQASDA